MREHLEAAFKEHKQAAEQVAKGAGVPKSEVAKFLAGKDVKLSTAEKLTAYFNSLPKPKPTAVKATKAERAEQKRIANEAKGRERLLEAYRRGGWRWARTELCDAILPIVAGGDFSLLAELSDDEVNQVPFLLAARREGGTEEERNARAIKQWGLRELLLNHAQVIDVVASRGVTGGDEIRSLLMEELRLEGDENPDPITVSLRIGESLCRATRLKRSPFIADVKRAVKKILAIDLNTSTKKGKGKK